MGGISNPSHLINEMLILRNQGKQFLVSFFFFQGKFILKFFKRSKSVSRQ